MSAEQGCPIPSPRLNYQRLTADGRRTRRPGRVRSRAGNTGAEDGGPLALLIAATYPDRVERLICFGTFARLAAAEDYVIGIPLEVLEELLSATPDIWGTGTIVDLCAPSVADDLIRERWADYERSAASPGQAQSINRRMLLSDVRPALSAITAPTLVMHRTGDLIVPVAMGRYLAEHFSGATFIELPGDDHWPFVGDVDVELGEIEEFVTGQRSSHDVDRQLATVLFTDIVDSTKTASGIGDRRWRELLDQHDALVRRQLNRFRGRPVKSTGDGFLATFDGPVRAMRCACAIRDGARKLGMEVRAGLHTGEIELRDNDVAGIAVHIAGGWSHTPSPEKYSSPQQSLPLSSDLESHSKIAVNITSREHPVRGDCLRSKASDQVPCGLGMNDSLLLHAVRPMSDWVLKDHPPAPALLVKSPGPPCPQSRSRQCRRRSVRVHGPHGSCLVPSLITQGSVARCPESISSGFESLVCQVELLANGLKVVGVFL